jgi:hypothetical protein
VEQQQAGITKSSTQQQASLEPHLQQQRNRDLLRQQ